jgi:hypothetical protein
MGQADSPDVARLLRSRRFTFIGEAELQGAIATLLGQEGIVFERERQLGAAGRIDFYLPDTALGIEVKVEGSPSAVARQLMRYAEHDEIRQILLVTSRARAGSLIRHRLNGKRVDVLTLWEGML